MDIFPLTQPKRLGSRFFANYNVVEKRRSGWFFSCVSHPSLGSSISNIWDEPMTNEEVGQLMGGN